LADLGAYSQQEIWYKFFGRKAFLPSNEFIRLFASELCNFVATDKLVCENLLIALCGPSELNNLIENLFFK